ncbi:hypothetical protein M407DRAFT_154229 [Tulasnella calospora MUT 4182]|uniref:Uncharacterized protein n=1 Tax=Tulasnella calospora MUT 4182 TaxID=1051891 RepID=A0A0C3QQ08_9AGAM|nr:hypothetical protein M407DRAFT_154229 [Tulasnella calospora MUT 4182]
MVDMTHEEEAKGEEGGGEGGAAEKSKSKEPRSLTWKKSNTTRDTSSPLCSNTPRTSVKGKRDFDTGTRERRWNLDRPLEHPPNGRNSHRRHTPLSTVHRPQPPPSLHPYSHPSIHVHPFVHRP